jgi:hypothetical protein
MHRRQWLVAAMMAAVAACGGARRPAPDQPITTLVVENQGYLDMVIYLIAGSARIRLGTAGGNRNTTLRIPPQYVFGVSSLQFLADPIGSNRTPISDSINVSPGDQIRLMIPPT